MYVIHVGCLLTQSVTLWIKCHCSSLFHRYAQPEQNLTATIMSERYQTNKSASSSELRETQIAGLSLYSFFCLGLHGSQFELGLLLFVFGCMYMNLNLNIITVYYM